jgi:hypothetical protein
MDREQIRAVVAEIKTYSDATQFVRSNGSVQILVPGGATKEQCFLLRRWHKELWWYLTTPPDATGECWRGHAIQWVCTSTGIWLCSCYYNVPAKVNQKTLNLAYRDYWTQERIAQ